MMNNQTAENFDVQEKQYQSIGHASTHARNNQILSIQRPQNVSVPLRKPMTQSGARRNVKHQQFYSQDSAMRRVMMVATTTQLNGGRTTNESSNQLQGASATTRSKFMHFGNYAFPQASGQFDEQYINQAIQKDFECKNEQRHRRTDSQRQQCYTQQDFLRGFRRTNTGISSPLTPCTPHTPSGLNRNKVEKAFYISGQFNNLQAHTDNLSQIDQKMNEASQPIELYSKQGQFLEHQIKSLKRQTQQRQKSVSQKQVSHQKIRNQINKIIEKCHSKNNSIEDDETLERSTTYKQYLRDLECSSLNNESELNRNFAHLPGNQWANPRPDRLNIDPHYREATEWNIPRRDDTGRSAAPLNPGQALRGASTCVTNSQVHPGRAKRSVPTADPAHAPAKQPVQSRPLGMAKNKSTRKGHSHGKHDHLTESQQIGLKNGLQPHMLARTSKYYMQKFDEFTHKAQKKMFTNEPAFNLNKAIKTTSAQTKKHITGQQKCSDPIQVKEPRELTQIFKQFTESQRKRYQDKSQPPQKRLSKDYMNFGDNMTTNHNKSSSVLGSNLKYKIPIDEARKAKNLLASKNLSVDQFGYDIIQGIIQSSVNDKQNNFKMVKIESNSDYGNNNNPVTAQAPEQQATVNNEQGDNNLQEEKGEINQNEMIDSQKKDLNDQSGSENGDQENLDHDDLSEVDATGDGQKMDEITVDRSEGDSKLERRRKKPNMERNQTVVFQDSNQLKEQEILRDVRDALISGQMHQFNKHKRPEDPLRVFGKGKSEKVYATTSNKMNFYQQARVYNPNTLEAENEEMQFLKTCNNLKITPLPIQAKIKNRNLHLFSYNVSEDLAQALCKLFETDQSTHTGIEDLQLSDNGLDDYSFSIILKGLLTQSQMKKILYGNNELGMESVNQLVKFLKRNEVRDQIEDLRLINLKTSGVYIMDSLVSNLSLCHSLKQLRISGMPMQDSKFHEYLIDGLSANRNIVELDISDCNLTETQLAYICDNLQDYTQLNFVNLSYNKLKTSKTPQQERIIQYMLEFIKNSDQLLHLQLSNMNLRNYTLTLGESIVNSKSLVAVHFCDNNIDDNTKNALCSLFQINRQKHDKLSELVKQRHHKLPKEFNNITASKTHIINAHLLNQIKQSQLQMQINYFQSAGRKKSQESPLIFTRILGHPELNFFSPSSNIFVPETQIDVQKWAINKDDKECWCCQQWNFVCLFYRRSKRASDFTQITKKSTYREIDKQYFQDTYKQKRPLIVGSLTDWKVYKMMPIREFIQTIDKKTEEAKMEIKSEFDQLGLHPNDKRIKQINRTSVCYNKWQDFKKEFENRNWREAFKENFFNNEDISIFNYPDLPSDMVLDCEDEFDLYVYVTYAPADRHHIIIKEPIKEEIFTQTRIVEPRKSKIQVKRYKESVKCPIFEKKDVRTKLKKAVKLCSTLNIDTNHPNKFPSFNNSGLEDSIQQEYTSQIIDWCSKAQCHYHQLQDEKPNEMRDFLRKETIRKDLESQSSKKKGKKAKKEAPKKEELETSMEADADAALETMLTHKKLVAPMMQVSSVKQIYTCFQNIFTIISEQSSFPYIEKSDFSHFALELGLLETETQQDIFEGIYQECKDQHANKNNHVFFMLDIAQKVSERLYFETNKVNDSNQAIEMFIQEYLQPFSDQLKWQEVRDPTIWMPEVNQIVDLNMKSLRQIYEKHIKKENGRFDFWSAKEIFDSHINKQQITGGELIQCFKKSITIKIMDDSQGQGQEIDGEKVPLQCLQFVEFLEFIIRTFKQSMASHSCPHYKRPFAEKVGIGISELLKQEGGRQTILPRGLTQASLISKIDAIEEEICSSSLTSSHRDSNSNLGSSSASNIRSKSNLGQISRDNLDMKVTKSTHENPTVVSILKNKNNK